MKCEKVKIYYGQTSGLAILTEFNFYQNPDSEVVKFSGRIPISNPETYKCLPKIQFQNPVTKKSNR